MVPGLAFAVYRAAPPVWSILLLVFLFLEPGFSMRSSRKYLNCCSEDPCAPDYGVFEASEQYTRGLASA